MTVLLVLFTLIFFLAADYVIQKRRFAKEFVFEPLLSFFTPLPRDVRLASNHVWVRKNADGTMTLGLDDFLAKLVGSVDKLVLPERGAVVSPAASYVTLQHHGKRMHLASPVIGPVVAVNKTILQNPLLLSQDPYERGWLLKVEAQQESASRLERFFVADPIAWLKAQMTQAKEFFASHALQPQLATMQDGGVPMVGLLQNYDGQVWEDFGRSFTVLQNTEH